MGISGIGRSPSIEQLVSISYVYFSFVSNLSQVLLCVNLEMHFSALYDSSVLHHNAPHRIAAGLPHHKHSGGCIVKVD